MGERSNDQHPDQFDEFAARYRAELDADPVAVDALRVLGPTVTLLYSVHDTDHNHARLLADYLSGG